jgi:lipoprotein-releasing system ATP-binding protein
MSRILTMDDIHKTYTNGPQDVPVLRGITLEVLRGDIVVVMGPSGVGKSTLLHVIGGLDRPEQGKVLIDGQDLFSMDGNRLAQFRNQHIGFVFQFHHLLPEFTALENVLIPAMMYRERDKKMEDQASELLAEVGLSDRLHHKPSELSGGEQQRVAVARALINRPQLVLADEPTGNLDKHNSDALYSLILNLNQKFKQTFMIVTHNEEMSREATRTIEMEDGRVRQTNVKSTN